jgi:transglutaminase-like putative cysteine protease
MGTGASTAVGFDDLKTITVVFPSLEVGDQIVLTTVFHQTVPWFGDGYAEEFPLSRSVTSSDVQFAVTAPSSVPLQIDAVGLAPPNVQQLSGKVRRTWTFSNPTAVIPESDNTDEFDGGPRLVVSSFRDYSSFARTYAQMLKGRAEPTAEIRALADKLTAGMKDDRQKAQALYDWVSEHIAYVNIVLGAGGFVPHYAKDVLATRYGDCKDHVILLEALLAAKGIDSSPVLINANRRYALSSAPDPAGFNHLITYVPSMNLYLDSTARYAPFGVLPNSDADKPVVRVANADTARTPVTTGSSLKSVETVTIDAEGSADGHSQIVATGAVATDMRAMLDLAQTQGDTQFIRTILGPGVDGSLQRGPTGKPTSSYTFSAQIKSSGALNIPGPGAMPYALAFKPFSITLLLAGGFPAARTRDYTCPSIEMEEDMTIALPANLSILSMPASETLTTEGITLKTTYEQPNARSLHARLYAIAQHPAATCTPAYYARTRGTLAKMVAALKSQILYR